MTKQEYYDLLMDSADNGTFPSADGVCCQYRGPDGKKCAIGLLIADYDYKPEFEGSVYSCNNKIYGYVKKVEGLTDCDLQKIQRCHDGAVSTFIDSDNDGYEDKIVPNSVEDFQKLFKPEINEMPCFDDVIKRPLVSAGNG
jgi:hypothetical protein